MTGRRDDALAAINGAPFALPLGVRIEAAKNGFARLRMPFDEKLLNPGDAVEVRDSADALVTYKVG